MNYLLDTNVCIYIIKEKPESVIKKFERISPMEVGVSIITVAELEFGVAKSQYPEKNRKALEQFILPLIILPFDLEDTRAYGDIHHHLESRGTPIGAMDMLIAAQARRREVVLVSNNEQEFSRIPGLRVENWVEH